MINNLNMSPHYNFGLGLAGANGGPTSSTGYGLLHRGRVQGKVNLIKYRYCLCTPTPGIKERKVKPLHNTRQYKEKNKACFKYRFEISFEEECFFNHICWDCIAVGYVARDCQKAQVSQATLMWFSLEKYERRAQV